MHFLPSQSFSLNSSDVRDRISVSRSLCLTINYIYVKLQWNEIASWLPIIKRRVHVQYKYTVQQKQIASKYCVNIWTTLCLSWLWCSSEKHDAFRRKTRSTVWRSLRPQPLLPNYTVVLVDSTHIAILFKELIKICARLQRA